MELDYVIIFCTISLFATLIVLASNTAFSQNQGAFSLYNNTDYGIQLLYPRDWLVREGDREPGDYYTDIVLFEPPGEQGKHFSSKFPCGEVCFGIMIDNALERQGLSLQQYADVVFNDGKKLKGFKLLEYNSASKLGDKKAFEHLYQKKQGNRDYIEKYMGTFYGNKTNNNFLIIDFKSRTKYSEQTLPLAETMINSFKFTNATSK